MFGVQKPLDVKSQLAWFIKCCTTKAEATEASTSSRVGTSRTVEESHKRHSETFADRPRGPRARVCMCGGSLLVRRENLLQQLPNNEVEMPRLYVSIDTSETKRKKTNSPDHSISVLVRMIRCGIVTPVSWSVISALDPTAIRG